MMPSVNLNVCVGCGLCVEICPEAFRMDGDMAEVTVVELPSREADVCREAADACPVDAITIENYPYAVQGMVC